MQCDMMWPQAHKLKRLVFRLLTVAVSVECIWFVVDHCWLLKFIIAVVVVVTIVEHSRSRSVYFFLSVSISIASNGFVLFFIRHIRAGNEYAIYVIAMNGQALLNWNPKRRRAWTITTFDESMAEQKRARFALELHFSILI